MSAIRRYRPSDRAQVFDVCLRTAAGGQDATGRYSDDELMPLIFAAPYLEFDPGLAFVVDTGTRVSGYVIATGDTRAFVEWYADQWLPRLQRFRHVVPPENEEQRMVDLGYRSERMLIPEVDDYPAHLHIDLLPELQGQGLGRGLVRILLAALRERSVRGVHLVMDPQNVAARAFYDRLGFRELASTSPTEAVLGIRTDAEV